jgi:short-subunit dehydrogenase
MKLEGSICLVTGASSGIGRATAIEMARRGATVALVARNAKALEGALAEVRPHSPSSTVHVCDVSDPAAVDKMTAGVLEEHDRVDVLFANAGVGHYRPFIELSVEEIQMMVATNLLGQMYCARAVLPGMMERRRGHLAFMSSTNGRIPPPLQSVYNATKFATIGFAETLLYEVEPYGLGVTIVYPGAIDTPFFSPEEFGIMRTPKKLPPDRVGRAVVRGIERGAYDVSVPSVLRLPAAFRVIAPPLIRKGIRNYAKATLPKPGAPAGG